MLKSTKCFTLETLKWTNWCQWKEGNDFSPVINDNALFLTCCFLSKIRPWIFNTEPLACWLFMTLLTYTPNYTDSIFITKLRHSIDNSFKVHTDTEPLLKNPVSNHYTSDRKSLVKRQHRTSSNLYNTDITITDYSSPSRYECYLYVKAE